MHVRRLVKAGQASHTVSLPKEWIVRNNLKKGDVVYINESGPAELTLTPQLSSKASQGMEKSISIDNKDIASIRREVTSAYINNVGTINIIGKSLNEKTKEIRQILDDFVALEITEQTSTRIQAKDLLNPDDISIPNTIRRMDMILRSILADSVKIMDGEELYESIHFRDADVNRIYFLLFRLVRSAMDNPLVSANFGISNGEGLATWYLAVNLENMADSSKNVSELLKESDKRHAEDIKKIYSQIEKSYLDVMKAYYKKDMSLAGEVSKGRAEVFENCDALLKKHPKYALARIVEGLKEMSTNTANIARITMDMGPIS